MTTKTLQLGRYIFLSRHDRTITISVRMLESIHMLMETNKWTLIVNKKPKIIWRIHIPTYLRKC